MTAAKEAPKLGTLINFKRNSAIDSDGKYVAYSITIDSDGKYVNIDYTEFVPLAVIKKGIENKWRAEVKQNKSGKTFYSFDRNGEPDKLSIGKKAKMKTPTVKSKPITTVELLSKIKGVNNIPTSESSEQEIIDFIKLSYKHKPKFLKMSSLKWKTLIRAVIRGVNILMIAEKGEGKTITALVLQRVLSRPLFSFNGGQMQDAQTYLIGKTHLKDKNTLFKESDFVKAITTPDAIVLLDEISRASNDAQNILIPVVDVNQRFLRLSEDIDSPIIPVAKGVTFIATGNFGNAYTATNSVDSALMDRFLKIEMDLIIKEDRKELLREMFPSVHDAYVEAVADIADDIRENSLSANPDLSFYISTRNCIDIMALINDGFSLLEAAEVSVYPNYSSDGGNDSERTFAKQLIQKYSHVDELIKKIKTEDNDIFEDNDVFTEKEFAMI